MTQAVDESERATQDRVVAQLQKHLGYRYLGNWAARPNNGAIENEILTAWLQARGVSSVLIGKTLHQLGQTAALGEGKNLYDANKAVYRALRYGVKVKQGAGERTETVFVIDWKDPHNNDFAVAEEVSLKGENKKRPDLVLYVNGLALGVLELKNSRADVSKGIRQNLDNQKKIFVRSFFTTVQLVMAGNDTQGLRYGTIETPEKHYLSWKEENPDYQPQRDARDHKYLPTSGCARSDNALDCALLRLCAPARFLELIHDFVVFDSGVKKLCRHNQYFGVKAAQSRLAKRDGGILWHNARLAVISRLPWIRKQQKGFRAQARQSRREMVTGETHYVWGMRYRLRVTERRGRHVVALRGRTMHLYVNPGTTDENRRRVLIEWYRDLLRQRIPVLLERWQPIIGRTAGWGIQRMKTRWGSCNVSLGRILLNLELAKKPPECLEYIVVHELVHLLERQHTQRFRQLMDHYFPHWERCRAVLNGQPLAEEEWAAV